MSRSPAAAVPAGPGAVASAASGVLQPGTGAVASASLSASLSASIRGGVAASSALAQLQQQTACCICYDSLSTAMSLPCLHSFCSLCIRRCLYLNAACPLCHAPATAGELRANFQLTQISSVVAQLQNELAEAVEAGVRDWARKHVPAVAAEEEQAQAAAAAAASAAQAAIATAESKQPDSDGQGGSVVPNSSSRSNSSKSSRNALPSKVECPCCGLQIVATRINSHLDGCLGKEENRAAAAAASIAASSSAATALAAPASSSASSAAFSSRLPFPVYGMLTDKQLRKLVADAGFPVGTGAASGGLAQDRDSLVRRHRELVLRHNSELDAALASGGTVAPQSDPVLVREILRKEKTLLSQAGKHGKQILLSAFANSHPAAAAHDSQHIHGHPAEQPFSVATSGSHSHSQSARKRAKVDVAAAATAPGRSRTPASAPAAPTILDLCDDSPSPSDSDPTTTAHAHAVSAASSAVPVSAQASDPASVVSTPAAAAAQAPMIPSSGANLSDPWSSLVSQYEARHGRRKRWRRAWGVDPRLYPAVECINVDAEEEGESAAARTSAASPSSTAAAAAHAAGAGSSSNAAAAATVSSATVAAPAPKSNKAVFSLFQHPSESVSPPIASASVAAAAASAGTGSAAAPGPTKSASSSGASSASGSAQIRVSKVLCASCQAVCRGSFPLGAQVVCPRCRPNWTTIAARQQRREEEAAPNPDVKVGWILQAQLAQQAQQAAQLAAQQQQQQHQPLQHQSFSAPAISSSNHGGASSNGGGSGSGSPVVTLSAEQRHAIEARRAAALSKLRRDKQAGSGSSTPPVVDAPAPDGPPAREQPAPAALESVSGDDAASTSKNMDTTSA